MQQQVEFNELAVNTVRNYKYTLSEFDRFLNEQGLKTLECIDESVVLKFKPWRFGRIHRKRLNSTGKSTLLLDLDMLHRVFAFAVDKQFVEKNPVRCTANRWDPARETKPYTGDELLAFRNHAGDDWFLFLLLRWTGFRRSDAAGIQWREADMNQKLIEHVCKKNGKKVTLPISEELFAALKTERERRNPSPNDPILFLGIPTLGTNGARGLFDDEPRLKDRLDQTRERLSRAIRRDSLPSEGNRTTALVSGFAPSAYAVTLLLVKCARGR